MARIVDLDQALLADAADVKALAARWRAGNRIDATLYHDVCDALNSGRCPQAVLTAVVNLAFVKRNAIRPTDPVQTFRAILTNQEKRVRHWASRDAES